MGAILPPTRHTYIYRTCTRHHLLYGSLMDMRRVKFSTARALRSRWGVGQVQREAVQVVMMRWGGGGGGWEKEERDAKRGQSVEL